MNKVLKHILLAGTAVLALASCAKQELLFDHEKPAMDTEPGKILIEAILPTTTAVEDQIFIAGPFAGDSAYVVNNSAYALKHSEVVSQKWFIYLDPSTFKEGLSLSDGFYFVNVEQGLERSVNNEDILHKLDAVAGERYNVYADRWRSYFANQDQKEEMLPEHDGVRVYILDQTGWDAIALYQWGNQNDLGGGWPGAQVAGTLTFKGVTYKYFEYSDDIIGLSQNLIFNNNGEGTQLSDYALTFAEGVKDYFLIVTESGVSAMDSPEGGIVIPEHDGVRVWVDNQTSWDAITLYQWGDQNDFGGGWPGSQVAGEEKLGDITYVYFEYGDDIIGLNQNLIFNNNGGGTQLADFALTFDEGVKDYFFQVTDTGAVLLDGPGGGSGEDGPDNPEPPVEEVKDAVTVYVLDNSGWDALYLYMWGDKELCGAWPGTEIPETTAKIGTVSYRVLVVADAETRNEHFIFNNNNGTQTPDDGGIEAVLSKEIFVSVAADGTITKLDPRNPDIKILVNNKTDWDAISLYAYGDAEAFGGWPGAAPVGKETVSGVEYTVFGLPAEMAGKNLNLIFNNNGGGQQLADFAITVPEDEIFLNINANYYVDFTGGNPRGEDSYIYVLDNMGWGENLHMYAWGDSEIFGGWAGAAGEAVGSFCGTPAYRFLVAAEHSGKTEHLIFNNGNGGDGNQFDGPEVKVGEDLFYSISDYTCDVAEPVVRVYVQDNTGWDALYVYVWGTSEIFGGWPGAAVSGEQTIGETTYKYAEIPAACFGNTANIIFNNNAGTQLENFDVLKDQKVGSDFFFTLTGDSVTTGK